MCSGDPTMYERYWQQMGEKSTVVIPGWKFISYFSDVNNLCWFLEPEFANAVVRLHDFVGNAVTKDRHIIVGSGSSQLFQAALYALSQPNNDSEPINVVSAAPYYSSYLPIIELVKSGLYKWGGDARFFKPDKPYIELVTSPNNPDGYSRRAVVNQSQLGMLIHDFAYYWPQYIAITSRADHDLMLFTVSKSTGHAGSRLGWAIVKNREVAKKMTDFVVLNTIGVSKESQIRAAKILQSIIDSHKDTKVEAFFEHTFDLMAARWKKLRDVINKSEIFTLPKYSPETCSFSGRTFATQPAFAWVKCKGEEVEDCGSFLRNHGIISRSGTHFGESGKYVRISVVPQDRVFEQFVGRLSTIG
ncbi:tryptophan aminotransferase related 2 [Striga asiatica]|uniref:Tryptophan aminotransferase related 2 n=1 Tax=Striga asiatica TaxID=4170 RepID=A0A5A7R5Y1_STRAF|nr:tryptophan aminotransferase related 2 [Striga asiatica]